MNWLELALTAARAVRPVLTEAARAIQSEEGRDIKVAGDTLAEKVILEVLQGGSPFPVLTEEAGDLPGTGEFRWLVDPLDGSLNFQRGCPLFCTSIGLWKGQQPVLGVICDLTRDETFTGVVGEGAWLNGAPIRVSEIDRRDRAILCTGFPHLTDMSEAGVLGVVRRIQEFKKVRLLGSAALSLAYVASGRLDYYTENGIGMWDVGAGMAIVQAAGGQVDCVETERPNLVIARATNGRLTL